MCGIAGVITYNEFNKPNQKNDLLLSILERLTHRGYRQFETAAIGNTAFLGTNRLEIVDRKNGRQPFISDNGQIALIFNGEIYNDIKLKETLIKKGWFFETNCDTEIILKGYQEWGIKSLYYKLKAMFAFIIYDNHKNTTIIARDPFGIKPLYWTHSEDAIFFSSEAKALSFLNSEIKECGPGKIEFFKREASFFYKCFEPENINPDPGITEIAAAKTIKSLFSEAVRKRVNTDLPVTVFLGGIDSGIVLSQAIKYNKNITAYSIGKDHDSVDVNFAKILCSELNVPLKIIRTDESELLSLVPEVVHCIESFEPNHIRGGCLSYLLARKVSQDGFRIALCGEGADELFCGYPEFAAIYNIKSTEYLMEKRLRFVRELYKTQLKRVDRTSMAFTLEVRVPFLDIDFASFALTLPAHFLLKQQSNNLILKYILRRAFADEMPEYALYQNKRVLSDGAGFGTNAEEGPFFNHACNSLSDSEFKTLITNYPEVKLKNKEEAYYFQLFSKNYFIKNLTFLSQRPEVNITR